MKKRFKKIAIALVVALSIVLSACAQTNIQTANDQQQSESQQATDKIKVVATTFPIYDWAREIIGENGENIELSLLIDNGVDIHSFQATTQDIAEISTSDLFVYIGGESDGWVHDVLSQAINQDMKAIKLVESLGDDVYIEEYVEGMQNDHDHDHDHDHDEDAHDHDEETHDHDEEAHDHDEEAHDHDEEAHDHDEDAHDHDEDAHDHDEETHDHDHHVETTEGGHIDEHIWLSLDNAAEAVEILTSELSKLDAENADNFSTNAAAYIEQLEKLDDEYQQAVDNANRNTLVFADRFPFRYMVEDYDLSYYAAFSGCSADAEASFETIAFLAGKVSELDIQNVLIIDGASSQIADTVISTSGKIADVIMLDSMQSTDADEIQAGATYLSIMEQNLEILKVALS